MLIIPAIDILKGNVVRLYKGDFDKEKVYSNNGVDVALQWQKKGAQFLHIVDLDGARTGTPKNKGVIIDILKNVNVPCEVAGGLRREEDVEYYLERGARRVVLGTKAFEDRDFLDKMIKRFGEKISVSIDFNKTDSGKMYIAKAGWIKRTYLSVIDGINEIKKLGIKTIILTDISRDGTLLGPDIDNLKVILEDADISVIVSGGISSLDDIKLLKQNLEGVGLKGVIIGKALYEGKIDLAQAIDLSGN